MDDLQTLLRPLIEHPEVWPEPVEWIAARARRRTRRRHGVTAVTAALALAAPLWVVRQRETSDVDTRTGPSTTSASSTSSTAAPTTTAPPPTFGAGPPWAGAAISAPAFVEAAANAPDTAAKCPVLAPDDLGEGAGAAPRVRTPTGNPGGEELWGVEYDLAGAPGHPEDHALPTADAGRDTFSISASLMPPIPDPAMAEAYGISTVRDLVTDRPEVHEWSDGSAAGWGGMLVDADSDMAIPSDDSAPPRAWVQIHMQGADPSCLYQVNSFLGEDHLFHLVNHLRRVEGTLRRVPPQRDGRP